VKQDKVTCDPGPIELEESSLNSYVIEPEEKGLLAGEKLSRLQDGLSSRRSRGYHKLEARDLVLVRDFQLAKEHGRKVHARCTTPRLLERLSYSGVLGHVRQFHDPPGRTKRFHLDDLLLYVQRDSNYP